MSIKGLGVGVSTVIDARAGVAKLVVVIVGVLQVMTLGLVVDVTVVAEAEAEGRLIIASLDFHKCFANERQLRHNLSKFRCRLEQQQHNIGSKYLCFIVIVLNECKW